MKFCAYLATNVLFISTKYWNSPLFLPQCSHTVYSGIELWFRGKNVSFLWLFQDCKSCLGFNMSHYCKFFDDFFGNDWLHGLRTRKLPSLHNWKSTPNPKCLGTAKAYSISHIGPNFQIWALNWVSVVRYWLHII